MEGVREREERRLEKKRSDMERYREEGDGEKERRERGRGGTERKITKSRQQPAHSRLFQDPTPSQFPSVFSR